MLFLLPGLVGMGLAQEPAATPAQTPAAASPPTATPAPTANDQAAPVPAAPAAGPDAAATPAGQSDAAPTTATPVAAPAATGKDGKPLKPKHPPKPKKVKPPPMVPVTIQRGVLTVDGWTGKADLNYTIMDLKYIYLWAPGIGTVVVSSDPFPGAQIQGNAIDGHTLTVNVEGHTLQLTSEHNLLSGKELVKAAYVLLDTAYVPDSPQYPQFGYGTSPKAPYGGGLAGARPGTRRPAGHGVEDQLHAVAAQEPAASTEDPDHLRDETRRNQRGLHGRANGDVSGEGVQELGEGSGEGEEEGRDGRSKEGKEGGRGSICDSAADNSYKSKQDPVAKRRVSLGKTRAATRWVAALSC